ncbi:ATP-dependent Clp protease adapter ClpS [Schumannella sp. 10F1B-5-1]|uniref:ATP-dependent Clp protease adapter ClpS n=1 Tax=Schumannella sp. 10F1B-5-1 TaxID=2590780 RepID=UPI0015E83DB3|nr:ATP-dependent Clp protease adapter ClpS [Schumannella sp. 10F1B-5-1]
MLLAAGAGTVTGTELDEQLDVLTVADFSTPWLTIVWNDPVNLMAYVERVFRRYFGFPPDEAHRLMMLVHTEGRAVVASGPREEMERHVEAMHEFGLQATVARDDA